MKNIKLAIFLACFTFFFGTVCTTTTIEKVDQDTTVLVDRLDIQLASDSVLPTSSGITTSNNNVKAITNALQLLIKVEEDEFVIPPSENYFVFQKRYLTPTFYEGGYLSNLIIV